MDNTYKYPDSMVEEYDEWREEELGDMVVFNKKKGIVGGVVKWNKLRLSDVWGWCLKK